MPTAASGCALRLLIVKVASRCNLACSYCYIYNKGDSSWASRSPLMSEGTFRQMVEWTSRQLEALGQDSITFLFHGGEPLLIGTDRFDSWCHHASAAMGDKISFAVQTNGILIDTAWIDVLRRHRVSIGISLDGPQEVNDSVRFDHKQRGSYLDVRASIDLLQRSRTDWALLSVVNLAADPLEIHRHFVADIGATNIDYLLPDHTHDTIRAELDRFGPTPVANWLIPIFDYWWANESIEVRISLFDSIIGSVLYGGQRTSQFGNGGLGYLVVETDGSIEVLDVLKICAPGVGDTGSTVWSKEPIDRALNSFHHQAVFGGTPLPGECRGCTEESTCGGGWLPHRYSAHTGFDNRSAWCEDLMKLFDHVRNRVVRSGSSAEHRLHAA